MTDSEAIDRLVERFDHHDPAFAREGVPQQVYARLRRECPVQWTDAHDGFWVLSRFEDVDAVAGDPETFSSALGINLPDLEDGLSAEEQARRLQERRGAQPMVYYDPPLHGEYRRALNPLFAPPVVRRREQFIRSVTTQFIDSFIADGACEVVSAFCAPVPAIVVLEWLGLPTDDWRAWSDAVLAAFHEGELGYGEADLDLAAVAEAFRERRSAPRDDVLSALLAITVAGQPITDEELVKFVFVLLMAGLDTTTNSVGSSLVELYRRPDLRRELAEAPNDDRLWDSAVEELLRYVCPVQGFRRTVRSTTKIGEQIIEAGQRVFILWASGNFDADAFVDPEVLDLRRAHNRHLSFGKGIHHCSGAHLARLEMKVMLQEFLHRIPAYEVDEANLELYHDVSTVFGYRSVPLRFPVGATRA